MSQMGKSFEECRNAYRNKSEPRHCQSGIALFSPVLLNDKTNETGTDEHPTNHADGGRVSHEGSGKQP